MGDIASTSTLSKPVTRGSTMAQKEVRFASPLATAPSHLPDEDTESESLSPTTSTEPTKPKRRKKPKDVSGGDPLAAVHLATDGDPLPAGQGHLLLRPEDTNDYPYGALFKNYISKHKNYTDDDIIISLLPVSRLATPRYTLQDVVNDDDVLTALWYYRESVPCWVFGFDLVSRDVFVWGQNRKPLVCRIVRILPSKWENLKPRLVDCYRFHYQDPSRKTPRVLHFIRYHSGMRFARWWREKISIPKCLPTLPRFDLREVLDTEAIVPLNEVKEGPPLKRPRLAASEPQQSQQPQQPPSTPARPVAVMFCRPPHAPPPPGLSSYPSSAPSSPPVPPPPGSTTHLYDPRPMSSVVYKWYTDHDIPVLRINVTTDVRFPPNCGLLREFTHRILDNVVFAAKQLNPYAQPPSMAPTHPPQQLPRM